MAVNSNDDARFKVVEYSPEKAEMIGYSNYSYWKSVFHISELVVCPRLSNL